MNISYSTNYMQPRPPWQSNSCSATQKIPKTYPNGRFINSPLVPIMSQMNPVHNLISHFFYIHFNSNSSILPWIFEGNIWKQSTFTFPHVKSKGFPWPPLPPRFNPCDFLIRKSKDKVFNIYLAKQTISESNKKRGVFNLHINFASCNTELHHSKQTCHLAWRSHRACFTLSPSFSTCAVILYAKIMISSKLF
jgi:hypothetical protein